MYSARKYRRLLAVTGRAGVALAENDTLSSCRWQDVQTIRETILTGDVQSVLKASARGEHHFIRVTCGDGKELVFRNFLEDLPWLAKIIHYETLSYLLPTAFDALKNGEELSFGKLRVDSEGLRSEKDKFLPWAEVQEVTLANALLMVNKKGKWRSWFKTPIGQVENPHVLIALAQLYREDEARRNEVQ